MHTVDIYMSIYIYNLVLTWRTSSAPTAFWSSAGNSCLASHER